MKLKVTKRKRLTMEELAARAAIFLKGKELNPNGAELFENKLKKAVVPKQRGLK